MDKVGPYTAGPEFQIHSDNSQENYPNVAKLATGFRVTWGNRFKGTLYTQRFYDLGQPLDSGPITVGPGSAFFPPSPWATALPTGSVVTWASPAPQDLDVSIFARLFGEGPNPIRDQFQVNTEIKGPQVEPRILALREGFIVTYLSNGRTFGQRYNSTYAPVGSELTLQGNAWSHSLAPFGQGFLCVYGAGGSNPDAFKVGGSSFDSQGRALSGGFLLPTASCRHPDVDTWPGGAIVVWSRWYRVPGARYTAVIEGQLFNQTLAKIGPVFPVSSDPVAARDFKLRVLALSNELIVVWDRNGEIRGRRVTHGGTSVDSEFVIGKGERPAISATKNGFVVVWAGPAVLGRIYTLPKPSTTTTLPTQNPFLTLPPAAIPSSTAPFMFQTILTSLAASTTTRMTPLSSINLPSLPSTTTSFGSTQLSTTFAAPVGSDSTTTVLVAVIIGLVLSLCASLGLYLHHRRKHTTEQEDPRELQPPDSSHQYVNLRVSKPSNHYQKNLPVQRQSTPANYDDFSVVEEENAYRNSGQEGD